jgi:RNA polymerase sigma-70 factor (sigma-E family)
VTATDPHSQATLATVAGAATEDTDQLIAGLFHAHELTLVRMALMLVGDRATAEDVVQDAFVGLYRAANRLGNPDAMLAYVRVSVVNGCRSVQRARRRLFSRPGQHEPAVWSAESAALALEDNRLTLQALARLPRRSREVLALRYYLDMTDQEIAAVLGVTRGTVSSTASRALAVLARELKEEL